MIKMSAGTAYVLGFKKLAIDALPTTAYLMSGEKCSHDCGFCPQARTASSRADLLSRVTWSGYEIGEVARGVHSAFAGGRLQRACLQVVDGHQNLDRVREAVKKIKGESDIPICVSTKVRSKEQLLALAEAGADRIGLALDAASKRVFEASKTGSWEDTLNFITEAARLLPGRISTHLIAGLGETEEEMVNMLQYMHDLGVTAGLFAFTPIPGTKMAGDRPPGLESYRRMQAANYLMGVINSGRCRFRDGRLVSFGIAVVRLQEYLKDGKAFQTSGCPGCNRPYYNEKPGGMMYNYPRPLKPEEITEAVSLVTRSLETELNG